MKDILLIAALLCAFAVGYIAISRIDGFMRENRRSMENEGEKEVPSCVLLTDTLTNEEIMDEIQRFRNNHEGTKILLYDGSRCDLPKDAKQIVAEKR